MGNRVSDDFGFVWDQLQHGWFEQQRCALVPAATAQKLAKRFPGDFVPRPVFDRESPTARRAVEVFQQVREKLPIRGWS